TFYQLVSEKPDWHLDAKSVPPSERKAFDAARQRWLDESAAARGASPHAPKKTGAAATAKPHPSWLHNKWVWAAAGVLVIAPIAIAAGGGGSDGGCKDCPTALPDAPPPPSSAHR